MTTIKKAHNAREERKQISDALTSAESRITTNENDIDALEAISVITDPSSFPHTLDTAGEVALVDLNGANKTVNLPATLTDNAIYGVVVYNSGSAGFTLTLGRNGNTMRYGGVINGSAGGSADDWELDDRGTIYLKAISTSVAEAIGVTTEV